LFWQKNWELLTERKFACPSTLLKILLNVLDFLDQRKNFIISKLSTSSSYTQHSQSTHALSSSKSQSQTNVKKSNRRPHMHRSGSKLRTSAQRMATNIPVGWNDHCLFFLHASFFFMFLPLWKRETDPNLSDQSLINISSWDILILTRLASWLDCRCTIC
jgi:hypothetical protein